MEEFPTSVTIKDFKFGPVKVYDNLFKILIFGGNNVGKTSIMKMALTKEFPDNKIQTFVYDTFYLGAKINDKQLKIEIWDILGKRNLSSDYFRTFFLNASLALLVYDMTSIESFKEIDFWLEKIEKEKESEIKNIILIGNKSDLKEDMKVSIEDAKKKYCSNDKIKYFFECSAKKYSDIEATFMEVVKLLYQKIGDNSGHGKNLDNDENSDDDNIISNEYFDDNNIVNKKSYMDNTNAYDNSKKKKGNKKQRNKCCCSCEFF